MKQFYETYKDAPKLSTLLREISWSHNLAIFSNIIEQELENAPKRIRETTKLITKHNFPTKKYYGRNYTNYLIVNQMLNRTTTAKNSYTQWLGFCTEIESFSFFTNLGVN